MLLARRRSIPASEQVATRSSGIGSNATSKLHKSAALSVAVSSLLGLGYTHAALGQEAGRESLEEITVTGSRIRRTSDFDTPNPTTVVDSAFLENLGLVNVGEAIEQLPSNISRNTPTTTGNANFFAGSTIANLRGLNPFFGSRTLNLVNTRRFVPTNQGDGVDLNFIPSILIDRMDVVTGGASAAYGSGAISGVNNIFLNRTLDGVRIHADYYQTEEGDGDDQHAALAFGTPIGDRGHIVVGFEHQDSDSIGCLRARDWCAEGNAFRQNTPAPPAFVLDRNVRANQISYNGVFLNSLGGATTLQATANGTGTMPFNIGVGANTSPFNNVRGGDGRSVYQYTNLRAPVERNVATGTFTFGLTDTVNLSVDASWGDVETVNRNGALDDQFRFIAADNAYLTPALQAAHTTYRFLPFPGAPAIINKDWTSQTNPHSVFTTEVKRVAVGLDGSFGDSTWTWETYYQYGNTEREQLVADNRHLNRYSMAIDAVAGPGGQIMCRVTRDGFAGAVAGNPFGGYGTANPTLAAGCVPINPFGAQPLSPAAYDYSFGFLRENLDYEQQVLAGSVSGDLFDGVGAGPFQLAGGAEYRVEKGENLAAEEVPAAERTDFLIQYGESFAGDVDVFEAFVELNTPLLRDRPGAQLLEFNLAARESRYENQGKAGTTGEKRSHDMSTWKIAGVWDPVEWLRFRGSRSRDSRAANFRELYYGQIIHAGGVFGFCGPAGTVQTDPCTFVLQGNVDLEPEKADTTTLGIVLKPLEGFEIGADYFSIEIPNAIQQASTARVLTGCRDFNLPEFCSLITFDGTTYTINTGTPNQRTLQGVERIRALAFNGSGYEFEGVDVSANYLWQINDTNNVNFRLIATKMLDQRIQTAPGLPFLDIQGQTGTANFFLSDNQPAADLLANLMITYTHGPLSVTAQARYVDDGLMNYNASAPGDGVYPNTPPTVGLTTGTTYNTNTVKSHTVAALNASYTFDDLGFFKSLQVFANIDNVFDKDPPIATGSGFGGTDYGGTNPIFYDTLGRAYRVGVRAEF